MRSTIFLIFIFFYLNIFSQESVQDQIVGNWKVVDIKIKKMLINSCGPGGSREKLEEFLNKNYLDTNLVIYSTNRLTYFSKNSMCSSPCPLGELINYKWHVLNDGQIELVHLRNNKEESLVDIKYEYGKLFFNLFGIEFRTEKL